MKTRKADTVSTFYAIAHLANAERHLGYCIAKYGRDAHATVCAIDERKSAHKVLADMLGLGSTVDGFLL